jgi:hypothetical protein
VVNREHALPKWILRKYDLYDKEVSLPHEYHGRRYGRHTIPCCKDCNSMLGRKLEQPVRRLMEGGHSKLLRHLDGDTQRLLFAWLSWIFLKFLIKDGAIPINPDHRGSGDARQEHRLGDAASHSLPRQIPLHRRAYRARGVGLDRHPRD